LTLRHWMASRERVMTQPDAALAASYRTAQGRVRKCADGRGRLLVANTQAKPVSPQALKADTAICGRGFLSG
jgi:hypothetical protein